MPEITLTIPETPAEFEESLMDKKRVSALMADPEGFKKYALEYGKLLYKNDPDLGGQLKASVKAAMEEFQQTTGWRGEQPSSIKRPSVIDFNQRSSDPGPSTLIPKHVARQIALTGDGEGVTLNGEFPHLRDYLRAIHPNTILHDGMAEPLKKAMGEGSSVDGGFLVPEEFRAELLALALEQAVVRSRARVIPMGSNIVKIPAIRDTSHATSVFGGVQASWLAEAADTSTQRQPAFSQVQLIAKKLTGYTVASNELLTDSPISLEAIINELFPQAIAYFEDDAFFNGTGAGQPLGILNADALIAVNKETGQAATTLVYENIVKMYARLLPQSMARAVGVANPDVLPQLMVMQLAVGTGGSAMFAQNATGAPPMTLMGRPVLFSEKCQTLGTAGDLYLADFGYYLIGDRQSLSMDVSPHVRFNTDEMAWRFVQRVDGRPWVMSALTPRNGSNTLSPFVDLATRS